MTFETLPGLPKLPIAGEIMEGIRHMESFESMKFHRKDQMASLSPLAWRQLTARSYFLGNVPPHTVSSSLSYLDRGND